VDLQAPPTVTGWVVTHRYVLSKQFESLVEPYVAYVVPVRADVGVLATTGVSSARRRATPAGGTQQSLGGGRRCCMCTHLLPTEVALPARRRPAARDRCRLQHTRCSKQHTPVNHPEDLSHDGWGSTHPEPSAAASDCTAPDSCCCQVVLLGVFRSPHTAAWSPPLVPQTCSLPNARTIFQHHPGRCHPVPPLSPPTQGPHWPL
jgi:hypothetical protein